MAKLTREQAIKWDKMLSRIKNSCARFIRLGMCFMPSPFLFPARHTRSAKQTLSSLQ